MIPLRPRAADREFVIGQAYTLEPIEDRSAASHRHYFAAIKEGWQNLPESLADEYPDPEMLRKKALIRTGYRSERIMTASSRAEARRLAAFIAPMDGYAIIDVRESVVRVWTAESQNMRSMGKARFQESKNAVLSFIAGLINVTPGDLSKAEAA